MTEVTFEDEIGATGSNADKSVLKTECMDACVSERTDTEKNYCCQVDMTPDNVETPTTYTSTCKMWSYMKDPFDTVDQTTNTETGV